jgi:hypothetical protein
MAAGAEDARVWMFEVMREYGLEQLAATGEWEAARRRHAAYYVRLAEEADSHMFGPRQGHWLRRLDQDYDNMRAALEGAIMPGDGETALHLGSALWHYWERRGYVPEGRRWLDRAFAVADNASLPVRARARYVAARLATLQADYTVAERWHEESRALAEEIGDQRLLGNLRSSWGGLAHGQGDYYASCCGPSRSVPRSSFPVPERRSPGRGERRRPRRTARSLVLGCGGLPILAREDAW